MFGNPSLLTRIVIGKGIGFLVGLIGYFATRFGGEGKAAVDI